MRRTWIFLAVFAIFGSFFVSSTAAAEPSATLDDFEGEVPFGNPEGIFTFGADGNDHPTLTVESRAREGVPDNHALRVDYHADAGGWGGVVHNLTYDTNPQDWSGFAGIRFWWYGHNAAPQPPGSGPTIWFEIKDGGAHAEASELWNTSFTDDFSGWTLIELPFSRFQYRTDFQPVGGINHELDLTAMWGFAFTPPAGRVGTFSLDDIAVYGVAVPPPPASVDTLKPVYSVREGKSVDVGVRLTTRTGQPLEQPVTIAYASSPGTATPGTDYTAVNGSLTFPAGTATGAVQTFRVRTTSDRKAEVAETVNLTLSGENVGISSDQPTIVIDAHGLPYLDEDLPIRKRVDDLLGRMTLAEKIGQMTQAERGALDAQDDIASWALGSLLSGGGSVPNPNTPAAWADMVDGFQLRARQTPLQIPLLYGVDAVHGHNNVVGATIFPHNVGLGATRDPSLVKAIGRATAKETRATGATWTFAPCLCVSRDERWGRAYEAFGESPSLVESMGTIVDGLQGNDLSKPTSVLATAKHWVGDGGTTYGSSTTGSYTTDQGITEVTTKDLWRLHIAPYLDALDRGVGTVMPSYSSVDLLDDPAGPVKMHAHRALITDVLKKKLRFDGFVISDWQGIDQIPGDYASDVVTAVNAGIDMVMVPHEYQRFSELLLAGVTSGQVSEARIDDAARRILRQKFRLGLFEKPFVDRTYLSSVGSASHRALARSAVAESQTLLKNASRTLPLKKSGSIYVAGSNADDIGNQSGGWTISWQGSSGATTPGTSILAGIRSVAPSAAVTYSRDASAPLEGHDVGVVVVGETPYAEGIGDIGNGRADLSLSAADRAAIDKVCAAMTCVVVVVSGRPMLVTDQLPQIDALVAAWLPGTEGAGVADTLFGNVAYTGRLPVTWPKTMAQLPINVGDKVYDPLFPYGFGLRTHVRR
ncbi:glycoside hydrolase family 3 N-terminal domain-containing protein [Tenggerimyces flavus]|uniref:beta-glucosidase n=1 Tax=Tenggerimyces flavus TaxID=1708749 RepID=A0ABV7YNG1_9ACTN|nr:glycoside hydrolase family 3 N-terminal domain-containing protein [Tenggerimyces flavus]MBM7786323.1 beta-glucosidase [Tenggerimyces flavus]